MPEISSYLHDEVEWSPSTPPYSYVCIKDSPAEYNLNLQDTVPVSSYEELGHFVNSIFQDITHVYSSDSDCGSSYYVNRCNEYISCGTMNVSKTTNYDYDFEDGALHRDSRYPDFYAVTRVARNENVISEDRFFQDTYWNCTDPVWPSTQLKNTSLLYYTPLGELAEISFQEVSEAYRSWVTCSAESEDYELGYQQLDLSSKRFINRNKRSGSIEVAFWLLSVKNKSKEKNCGASALYQIYLPYAVRIPSHGQ